MKCALAALFTLAALAAGVAGAQASKGDDHPVQVSPRQRYLLMEGVV